MELICSFLIWHFCCGLQELEKGNKELQLIDKGIKAQKLNMIMSRFQ